MDVLLVLEVEVEHFVDKDCSLDLNRVRVCHTLIRMRTIAVVKLADVMPVAVWIRQGGVGHDTLVGLGYRLLLIFVSLCLLPYNFDISGADFGCFLSRQGHVDVVVHDADFPAGRLLEQAGKRLCE